MASGSRTSNWNVDIDICPHVVVTIPFLSILTWLISHLQFSKMLTPGLVTARLPPFSYKLNAAHWALIGMASAPVILSLPPDSVIRRVLYPLPGLLVASTFLLPKPLILKDVNEQYQFGVMLALWLARLLDRLYLHPQPEVTFQRKTDADKNESPSEFPLRKKFLWALELITVSRGLGWNWEVGIQSTEGKEYQERVAFLQMRMRKIIFIYLGLFTTTATSGFILNHAHIFSNQNPLATVALRIFMWWGYFSVTYSNMTVAEDILSVIFVGLGIGGCWSQPKNWPPTFGDATEAYSFRRFWGYVRAYLITIQIIEG